MTDIHVYPADDPDYNTGGRVLHSPSRYRRFVDKITKDIPSGRYSSLSLRSLPRSSNDLDIDEGGAEIPDIPLRRAERMAKVLASIDGSSSTPLAQILAGNRDMLVSHNRPINPNDINKSKEDKVTQNEDVPAKRVASPEPADERIIESRTPSTYPRSMRSKANSSAASYQTNDTSLVALQTKGAEDGDALEPLLEEEIEPGSFDLVIPAHGDGGLYSLEKRSELLFSKQHLAVIFEDPALLQHFTTFLCTSRPTSVPLLVYYLDAVKALKAISYSNAVIEALIPLEGHDFSGNRATTTINESLKAKAAAAFEAIARDDLPAYITHVWIQKVSVSIRRRISGTLPAHLRDMSEGLAEVFCLTDPSRHDNPIVFASEEFHRTTQYGMNYVLGRNCRFLQGPRTNHYAIKRIRERLAAGKEHYETFLNYRRDGSPFMNLLMIAPLYDSRGTIRYFIGAQVDVSGLAKDCSGLEALQRLTEREEAAEATKNGDKPRVNGDATSDTKQDDDDADEFRELTEMFNLQELETVRKHGGNMHRLQREEVQHAEAQSNWHKPRVLIQDSASIASAAKSPVTGGTIDPASGRLTGVYENYLLVRPYPSLRILFASPSLRVPGILQSSFLSRIGGSARVRDELTQALADGHGVTAKVRWVSSAKNAGAEGRPRWIHCTPLLGSNGAIGVWMVVIVDDEAEPQTRKPKEAPPVPPRFDRRRSHARKQAVDDTLSLREFAAANRLPGGGRGEGDHDEVHGGLRAASALDDHRRGGRGSAMGMHLDNGSMRSIIGEGAFDDTRPSSPYTLRIGED